jgi:hypothetical protein
MKATTLGLTAAADYQATCHDVLLKPTICENAWSRPSLMSFRSHSRSPSSLLVMRKSLPESFTGVILLVNLSTFSRL